MKTVTIALATPVKQDSCQDCLPLVQPWTCPAHDLGHESVASTNSTLHLSTSSHHVGPTFDTCEDHLFLLPSERGNRTACNYFNKQERDATVTKTTHQEQVHNEKTVLKEQPIQMTIDRDQHRLLLPN